MKYNKIFMCTIILLTKNILCYNTKDLNDFLYGSSLITYTSKNLSVKKYNSRVERKFINKHFLRCRFSLCSFNNFTLSNTIFNNSLFFDTNFIYMDLSTSIFNRCDMHGSKFINCNLRGSRFILCQGLSPEQKYQIERNGGIIIEKIIKVKSNEEYWEAVEKFKISFEQEKKYKKSHGCTKDEYCRLTKGLSRTSIIIVEPILKKIKNKLLKIKNKISRTINKIHNASMQKTRKKIQNIYSY